ncbi:MAG: amidohydrolase family protein [Alphaproteobacteria bacterium]|nr:amidohydrolase family protein [Alphaproteobacteria bacterium]MCZ6849813.1 amidohydrolase family protein [Alphaproteobacteria bacterium]
MALVIDIHAHLVVEESRNMMKAAAEKGDVGAEALSQGGIGISQAQAQRQAVLADPEKRIEDMDKIGVDISALSPAPPRGFYEADSNLSMTVAQLINDRAAEIVKTYPDRFVAMGVAPLHHVGLAVVEMERAVGALDLRGIRLPTEINGMELSDPSLEPFWDAAERLETMIYIHPQGFSHPQRLKAYYMTNVVGNPLETTLAMSHLIHSGVIARHPNLKFYFAHGGGFLPFYVGRFDHAWRERQECREHTEAPPSTFLANMWFDTVVFRPEQIRILVDLAGAERVMLGTDRPYDMGEPDPVALVNQVEGLSDTERETIMGGAAKALLKMD